MEIPNDVPWHELEDGEEIEHCMPFRASTPPLTHAEPQPDPMETFAAMAAAPLLPSRSDDEYRPGAYRDLYATRDDVRRRQHQQHYDHRSQGAFHGGREHSRRGFDGDFFRDGGRPLHAAARGRDGDREPRSVNYFPREGRTDRPARPARGHGPTPLPAREMHAFVFMRQRNHAGRTWFEFLLELRNDRYGFIELPLNKPAMAAAEIAAKRGLLFLPKDARDLERCRQHVVDPKAAPRAEMQHEVYFLPAEATQRERSSRTLPHKAQFIWACESELATHTQMGPPTCIGNPVSPHAIAAIAALPVKLRFASMKPPLVVYHGTSVDAGNYIAGTGFKVGPKSMLGPGVYFAKFDKALDFAYHDAANVQRPAPGLVVRTYVLLDSCATMTRDKTCTCGCDKPFVDHDCHHGKDHDATFVPDNSLPATRRAEWCVRDPRKCFVDCLIVPPKQCAGAHRLPPQFVA